MHSKYFYSGVAISLVLALPLRCYDGAVNPFQETAPLNPMCNVLEGFFVSCLSAWLMIMSGCKVLIQSGATGMIPMERPQLHGGNQLLQVLQQS